MEVRFPKDKHERAMKEVQKFLHKNSVSHHALEKLLGFLSFCARVIPLGGPFLRNLFTFLHKLSYLHPFAMQHISSAARRDLRWWATLLPHWSGIRMINSTCPRIYVHTDASGSKGIGGWYNSDAFSSRCPRQYRSKRIEWKEAYAVLFAFAKWDHC